MPGWLLEARGTTGLMLEALSSQCRESIEQACRDFEMSPACAKALAALAPGDIPALLEALGPGQVIGLRSSLRVEMALAATSEHAVYGKGASAAGEWGSEFGLRSCLWLEGVRRACRESEAEARVLFALEPVQSRLFAQMCPAGVHSLMQKVAPRELLRFRDSSGLASMLRGLRGSEERALDVQLADRFAHSLRK
jgi:hypothetical protein